MELLAARADVTLDQIAKQLRIDKNTASEHTFRLLRGGHLVKRYRGREVLHRLTPLGRRCLHFLRSLD